MRTPDGYDIIIILGAGLVGLGLWLIYPPAALVVMGLAVMAAGLFLAARAGRPIGPAKKD